MKRECDKIVFEDLEEVGFLLNMVEKYRKQNPEEKDNKIVKRFYDLLYDMELSW